MLCPQPAASYCVSPNFEASDSGAYYWKAAEVGCKFIVCYLLWKVGNKIHRVGNEICFIFRLYKKCPSDHGYKPSQIYTSFPG